MRIPFPEQLPMSRVIPFAAVLAGVQAFEGTGHTFVLFHAVFVILWALAFNIAGGFRHVTGAYVFWFGLFTILLGTTLRALIGQPADDTSQVPVLTMLIYTISMLMMVVVTIIIRFVTSRMRSLPEQLGSYELDYRSAAIGCLALGTLLFNAGLLLPKAFFGQVFTTIFHMGGFLLPVAVLLGTIDRVQSSGGRHAMGWLNGLAMLSTFFSGFVGFSKEGMLSPIACWIIGMAYTRFSLKWRHFAGIALFAILFQLYLYPLAQLGRFLLADEPTFSAQIRDEFKMIEQSSIYRARLADESQESLDAGGQYFSRNLGFVSRFTRWMSDDPLIAFTEQGHHVGYAYFRWLFLNWFPHLLIPDKDKYFVDGGGNYYAREMGSISEDNTGTGISFGAPAEAFHMDGWEGVCLTQPIVWLMFFFSTEFICGDLRKSPWGTPLVVALAHIAPEGAISGLIVGMWMTNIALIACILFSVYVAPVLGTVIADATGTGGRKLKEAQFWQLRTDLP